MFFEFENVYPRVLSNHLTVVENSEVLFRVPFSFDSETGEIKPNDEKISYSLERRFRYLFLVDDKKEKGILTLIKPQDADEFSLIEPGDNGGYLEDVHPNAEIELFVSNIGKENERIVPLMEQVVDALGDNEGLLL